MDVELVPDRSTYGSQERSGRSSTVVAKIITALEWQPLVRLGVNHVDELKIPRGILLVDDVIHLIVLCWLLCLPKKYISELYLVNYFFPNKNTMQLYLNRKKKIINSANKFLPDMLKIPLNFQILNTQKENRSVKSPRDPPNLDSVRSEAKKVRFWCDLKNANQDQLNLVSNALGNLLDDEFSVPSPRPNRLPRVLPGETWAEYRERCRDIDDESPSMVQRDINFLRSQINTQRLIRPRLSSSSKSSSISPLSDRSFSSRSRESVHRFINNMIYGSPSASPVCNSNRCSQNSRRSKRSPIANRTRKRSLERKKKTRSGRSY
jgi:hypothetical protein